MADQAAPTDDEEARRRKLVRATQAGLLLLAALIAVVVVLSKGDDGGPGRRDRAGGEHADGDKGEAKKRAWPAELGGRPPALGTRGDAAPDVSVEPDTRPGVYVWNDFDGWHLWVVAGADVAEVHGTLTSSDDIAKAELAVPGAGTVETKGKVSTFSLPGDAALAGIDFNPGFFGDRIEVQLSGPDGPIDPTKVFVGSKAAEAPSPFVIEKA